MGIKEESIEGKNKEVEFAPDVILVDTLITSDNLATTPTRKRRDFKRSQHHFSPRCSRRSLPGLKQVRRQENFKFLLSQLEDGADINESGQVDLVDLIAQHHTGFTELFLENDNMSAWNEFINQSEEEQSNHLAQCCATTNRRRTQSESMVMLTMEGTEQRVSPDLAFQRISHRLRRVLCKRHVPKGELCALEEQLVEYFAEDPDSVYVARMQDGFRRLMLHAVSQYLNLDARSVDDYGERVKSFSNGASGDEATGVRLTSKRLATPVRLTHVENTMPGQFSPPATKLVDFLDSKMKNES